MDDAIVLWGASTDGILKKLPTREGRLDDGQAYDKLETISSLVLGRVGAVGSIPPQLEDLAAKVVEYGAAALLEITDFPEQSTDVNSTGQVLWRTYMQLLDALVKAVEAVGGSPDVMERPAYNFPPPSFIGRMPF